MMTKSKVWSVLAIALPLIAVAAFFSPRGQAFAGFLAENRRCCQLPLSKAFGIALQETLGNPPFPSEIGQDKWVAEVMFPGIADGVFLDVGSGHGQIGGRIRRRRLCLQAPAKKLVSLGNPGI